MYILAFDPGLATGFAVFADEQLIYQETIESGAEGFLKEFPQIYQDYADLPHVIVIERFIPTEHVRGEDGIHSNRIEGILMALTQTKIVWQLRSDKALLFNQKQKLSAGETERFRWLRDRGFKGNSHELDAITHALVYMKRQQHEPALNKYWL